MSRSSLLARGDAQRMSNDSPMLVVDPDLRDITPALKKDLTNSNLRPLQVSADDVHPLPPLVNSVSAQLGLGFSNPCPEFVEATCDMRNGVSDPPIWNIERRDCPQRCHEEGELLAGVLELSSEAVIGKRLVGREPRLKNQRRHDIEPAVLRLHRSPLPMIDLPGGGSDTCGNRGDRTERLHPCGQASIAAEIRPGHNLVDEPQSYTSPHQRAEDHHNILGRMPTWSLHRIPLLINRGRMVREGSMGHQHLQEARHG